MRFQAQQVGGMLKTRQQTCGHPYGETHPARNHWGMLAHDSPEFGHDKAPLIGGGCNLCWFGVFKHRASRLGGTVARMALTAIHACRINAMS